MSVTKQQRRGEEAAEAKRLDTLDPDQWEALVKEAFEADGVEEYRHVWDELLRREQPMRMEEERRREKAREEKWHEDVSRRMDERMDERIAKEMERRLDEYIQVGIHRDFAEDYARYMARMSC